MKHQTLDLGLLWEPMAGYLGPFRAYYPGISDWLRKISPGFLDGSRKCYVVYSGSSIHGLAITKRGKHAKLCHISVAPSARARGLGSELLNVALLDLLESGATEVCVTTGEEVYRQFGRFFSDAGFTIADRQVGRYRPGVEEIIWAAPSAKLLVHDVGERRNRIHALHASPPDCGRPSGSRSVSVYSQMLFPFGIQTQPDSVGGCPVSIPHACEVQATTTSPKGGHAVENGEHECRVPGWGPHVFDPQQRHGQLFLPHRK